MVAVRLSGCSTMARESGVAFTGEGVDVGRLGWAVGIGVREGETIEVLLSAWTVVPVPLSKIFGVEDG